MRAGSPLDRMGSVGTDPIAPTMPAGSVAGKLAKVHLNNPFASSWMLRGEAGKLGRTDADNSAVTPSAGEHQSATTGVVELYLSDNQQ